MNKFLEAFILSLNLLVGQNILHIVSIIIIAFSYTVSKNCYGYKF